MPVRDLDLGALGRRLATRRVSLDLTQQEVARRAGLSEAYVNRLEGGLIPNPKIKDLLAVTGVLGLRREALFADPTTGTPDLAADLARFPELARTVAGLFRQLEWATDQDVELVRAILGALQQRFATLQARSASSSALADQARHAVLLEIARRLSRGDGNGASQRLRQVLEAALALTGADVALVYRWDPARGVLEHVQSTTSPSEQLRTIRPGQGVTGLAAERLAPVTLDDYASAPGAIDLVTAAGIRTAAAVPLLRAGRLLGVLSTLSYVPSRQFERADVEALELLASIAGSALAEPAEERHRREIS